MSAEPKETIWVNVFIFMVIGYVCIFVQSRLTTFRDIFGTQFDLVPGLIAYAAVSFNFHVVLGVSAGLGLLMDLLSANALGASMLAYLVVAVLGYYFRELLLSEQFVAQFALGTATTGAITILTVGILHLIGQQPLLGLGTVFQWLLVSTGGGAVTPLWFKLFTMLDQAFRYKEVPESSFRPDREIARGR